MKQIIASVFFVSWLLGIIFCIFKFNNYNCKEYKLRLAKVNFLSCFITNLFWCLKVHYFNLFLPKTIKTNGQTAEHYRFLVPCKGHDCGRIVYLISKMWKHLVSLINYLVAEQRNFKNYAYTGIGGSFMEKKVFFQVKINCFFDKIKIFHKKYIMYWQDKRKRSDLKFSRYRVHLKIIFG